MSTLLVNGKYEDCSVVGLNPYCQLNLVPEVRMSLFLSFVFFQPYCFNTCLTLYLVFTCQQANSDFWKVKYDHEAAKKAKAAAINAKKTTRRSKKKKRSTAEDLMKLDDTFDSEVALDSLANF